MLKWVYGGIGDQSTFLELELVLLYWDSKNKWSHWCNCSFRHNPTGSVVFNEDSTSWGRLKRERKREGRKERKKKKKQLLHPKANPGRFICYSFIVSAASSIDRSMSLLCKSSSLASSKSVMTTETLLMLVSHTAWSSLVEGAIEQGAP